MFGSRAFFALLLFITASLTFLGSVFAQDPTEPGTGKIICISPNDPHVCQIRYTAYSEVDSSHWPLYRPSDYPYNGNKYPQSNYDVWVDVYDGFCRHIGLGVGYQLKHMSVSSELPWTVEIDPPQGFPRMEEVTGRYGGGGLWPSTHIVTYTDPGDPKLWGYMATALFGFAC